ncbi:MAG: hypothetical protein LCH56_09700 [Proteobacteria bacterium]|nr:hypothetical protein [Pseudomonadota bacterium]
MRQRLFYKPPKKLPRMVWGSVLGLFLVLIYLRTGLETGVADTEWLLPLGLSMPAGAVGGYLYTTLDPVRARGHNFVANIVGGAMYLVLLGAAFAVGINS